ncbi:Acetyl esterase/lipase [Streptomyces sp. yr375]|uniref:alpha/beta hydrolase n=1 Tax=Streptomyces sp. yr375 TaxID=1761906 RepID=UPI0008C3AE63|nr:alpha/beta hydrolase [Streptomyces sp. yr375]SER70509.1 Acetyl esterase/lipase [Streptomyces sp. yr375]
MTDHSMADAPAPRPDVPCGASTNDARPGLHLPARHIPVPTSVSEEAQAVLARGVPVPTTPYPQLDDLDGWRALSAATDEAVRGMVGDTLARLDAEVEVKQLDLDGFPVHVITPAGLPPDDRRVYLEIHGGAWISGKGEVCRARGILTSVSTGARVWAVDYRMPPDHRYPVALDDCLAAYRALLGEHRPEEIVVGGSSAGGNLAAALLLRARDEGLPLPAALVLSTPATDLTGAGDSLRTNLGLDSVLSADLMPAIRLYAAGHDLRDPGLSPLFGDLARGFPPTILTTGTRDLLLSDTVRMHRALRAAGIEAELHVFEAAGHGMFLGGTPEDRDKAREIRRFIDEHWARGRRR